MSTIENPPEKREGETSPLWNNTTKLVVGLTLAGLLVALLFRFKNILPPLLTAIILAYLFYPLASYLNKRFKIPWRLISTLLYLLILVAIIGLLTWGGISIFEQIQNLINFVQGLITDLPAQIETWTSQPLLIGPFTFDLSKLDLESIWSTLQGVVQPLLSNLGSLIGSLASGIGSTLTWLLFIILISYFIMSESNGVRSSLIRLRIPRYREDVSKLGNHLAQIWNAFLRGQLLLFAITVVVYSVILSILGVRYFFLLAILAGLARFVPYVGPWVTWATYFIIGLFQTNYLGLQPLPYALLVVGVGMFSDVIMDNFVSPRIMSDVLSVHPAAVLVMVIVSASLFGLLGVLLAAPTLASLKLLLTYVVRKLMDEDPWEGLRRVNPPKPLPRWMKDVWKWLRQLWAKIRLKFQKKPI
jgi:predicted PurR-regulated permease PerM